MINWYYLDDTLAAYGPRTASVDDLVARHELEQEQGTRLQPVRQRLAMALVRLSEHIDPPARSAGMIGSVPLKESAD